MHRLSGGGRGSVDYPQVSSTPACMEGACRQAAPEPHLQGQEIPTFEVHQSMMDAIKFMDGQVPEPVGTLTVHLLHGSQLKDVSWLPWQDPYCFLQIGTQTFRSASDSHGGRKPVWNQAFTFTDVTANQVLHIKCFHESIQRRVIRSVMAEVVHAVVKDSSESPDPTHVRNVVPDKGIGTCTVQLNQVVHQGRQELEVDITKRGEYRGTLHLRLEFEPTAMPTARVQLREPAPAYPYMLSSQAQVGSCASSEPLNSTRGTVPTPGTPAASGSSRAQLTSPSKAPLPLSPSLELMGQLLGCVKQWPEECLRPKDHKSLLHNGVQHLKGKLANMWIEPKALHVGPHVGSGGFSDVTQGAWAGQQVAIKYFRPFCPDSIIGRTLVQSFVRELCLLSQLDHQSIVRLHGFTANLEEGWLGIVLEWVGPSLATLIADKTVDAATPQARLQWAIGVAEGVRHLHSQAIPVVHRDLTSSNILIGPQDHAKLIDFGVSQWLQQTSLTLNRALTPPWMPPEVLSGKQQIANLQVLSVCTEKCDVYSFGVILGQLATTAPLWQGLVGDDVVRAFTNGARLAPPAVQQDWLHQLIAQCISEEPANRPSMADVLHVLQSHDAEGILRSSSPWPVTGLSD